MIPTVIAKIISMQPNFTMSENEISQYVINNTDSVISSTITTIAKETNTSEASINRFCKKMGYKGFNSFKIALMQENFYNNMKQQNTYNANEGLIESITADYRQMLINTSAMMSEENIIEAVEYIKSAKNIHIFALSNSAFLASELEFKLRVLGISAKAHTDVFDMHISAINISPKDVAIIIAPTILMRDIYQCLTTCHEKGAKIISISSYDSSKLNDFVNVKFITSDKITAKNSISLSNNLMYLYVLDLIYSALLKSDKSLREKKLNSDSVLNSHQTIDNNILEY
ncbi:MurR/RpiR family transcriptional regulator [Geosporobacter ferrireducens]|uniref:MurR/RpiR family transcriptional regulator n=1 Tax=Geosporobacter ferrireducens TaxID=1424294 RepID=UPI00139BF000|nr:MurR/RpiR family transcriptional regulator [Geosporobacter ferrireducens]MTI56972.1 MurR/RpiR family transcriptional regulator [Geosporobacter ferrireducens]